MKLNKLETGLIIGAVIAGLLISALIVSRLHEAEDVIEETEQLQEATPVKEEPKFLPRAEAEPSTPEKPDNSVTGIASYYNRTICPLHDTTYQVDCYMKNQEMFDDQAMVAACPRELLGKTIKVLHKSNEIIVECTDTGSFSEKYGRVLDLSEGAFSKLAPTSKGIIEVSYEEVT